MTSNDCVYKTPLKLSDKILYTNILKQKKLPNTKNQPKYFGPDTVCDVSENHVTIATVTKRKTKRKIPIHTVCPYYERSSGIEDIDGTDSKRTRVEPRLETRLTKQYITLNHKYVLRRSVRIFTASPNNLHL